MCIKVCVCGKGCLVDQVLHAHALEAVLAGLWSVGRDRRGRVCYGVRTGMKVCESALGRVTFYARLAVVGEGEEVGLLYSRSACMALRDGVMVGTLDRGANWKGMNTSRTLPTCSTRFTSSAFLGKTTSDFLCNVSM